MVKKQLDELPASDKKEFWGEDADINLIHQSNLVPEQINASHYPIYQVGDYFVCRGCKYEHTIPLDNHKFTIKDGRIVPLDKINYSLVRQ